MPGDVPRHKVAAKPTAAASRPAIASAPPITMPYAAAANMATLSSLLGNRGLQALVSRARVSRTPPQVEPLTRPVGSYASAQVREALARPGLPLAEASAARLSQLLQLAHAAPQEPGPVAQVDTRARVMVAEHDSAVEVVAREVAAAVSEHALLPAITSAPLHPAVARARIHADAHAASAARALRARAFVAGDHVFFGPGRFAPNTHQGERLLLHELVHVAQQARHPAGLLVLCDGEADTAETAAVTMTVSMDNVIFNFGNRRYRPGATQPQLWPLMLQRLLGTQYNASLEGAILTLWQQRLEAAGRTLADEMSETRTTQADSPIGMKAMSAVAALLLIEVLEIDFSLVVNVTDEQHELLLVGFALESAWPLLEPRLPPWYSEFMFRRQMASHAPLARHWQRMAPNIPGSDEFSDEDRSTTIDTIFDALIGPINIVEAIRNDFSLGNAAIENPGRELEQRNRAQGGTAYRFLWRIETPATQRLTAPPAENRVHAGYALALLSFVHTQPDVCAAAALEGEQGHAGRLELLGRFHRYYNRAGRFSGGDERLFDVPARNTDAPWNARLSSTPPLSAPLYDAALETDHAFTMQLEFGHVTDAFVLYAYLWKFVRIPDPAPDSDEQPPDPLTAAGAQPSFSAVLDTRLARARRYNATDLERIRSRFGSTPWGEVVSDASFGADLVRLNNKLRTLGTVIRTVLIEPITEPHNTTRYVFPEAGMYVAVCRAVPVLEGHEEVTHAPSIAMLPVVATDPDVMAVSRAREASRNEFQMQLRLAEIRALLDSPIPPGNATDLQAEMEELQAMLAEPGEALVARRNLLEQQIALLRRRLALRGRLAREQARDTPDAGRVATLRRELFDAGGEASSMLAERDDLRGLQDQLDTIKDMIDTRARRAEGRAGARLSPHASFVSDLGASLELALEIYDSGVVDGEYQVYISDLTTADSGEAVGTAAANRPNARVAAVLDGLTRLLEEHSDYGRGRVAIQLEGEVHLLRVDAGTGRMLMEGIENGVTVLSLAAIVAAPFTAGESLVLLLPLGAVGAIPSAYRLYQRYDEHRLRFDLAAAMDVVNIVSGVIGLAHAATPLRMVRLGRVLMVAGLGADGAGILMMGAGLVVQIEALRNLPEHERAARLLEIIGNAMLQIGIQAGGMVMHARYQHAREASAAPREGSTLPRTGGDSDAPGFRLPSDTTTAAPHVEPTPPASADRTAAGTTPPSRPPSGGGPRPPLQRASTHDRLMARFESGIDYSRPPPAADVAHPPPAGEYRRRLRTDEAAFNAYNDAVAVSGGREVGLFHNPRTGEYRAMIGDETGVSTPARSGWDAVVHYHPDGGTRLTYRLPSPHDFQGLIFRYLSRGGPVREFIEFDIPGVGRGRTEYGIDPAHAEPFYVRIQRPNETPQTLRFAHDGAFRAYWGERTVYVEPGSPLYEAMIRDIQGYVRSLDSSQTGAAPPRRTEAGSAAERGPATGGEAMRTPPARQASGDRSAAGNNPAVSGRLLDDDGVLTDAGVEFIRREFPTVLDFGSRRRRVSTERMTDAEIRGRYPSEWAWLQAAVAGEARQSWIGRETPTDFLLSDPQQSLRQVASRLADAVAAGNTGHTLDLTVLNRNALEFILDRVAANDPTLRPAWDALETTTNPVVRDRWHKFLYGEAFTRLRPAERQRYRRWLLSNPGRSLEGFAAGLVGNKQPDLVEVRLSQDTINVLDPSQRWSNPVHNFKTAFYEAVLRQLIDVADVGSADTGGGARVRPTGG